MKICILCEYYPPLVLGGAEFCAKILAEGLSESGIKVVVLTPNYEEFKTIEKTQGNLTIIKYKTIRKFIRSTTSTSTQIYNKNKTIHKLLINQYVKFSAKELARVFKCVNKRFNFDIVQGNNIESTLALAYLTDFSGVKVGYLRDLGLFCPGYRTKNGEYCCTCNSLNVTQCQGTNNVLGMIVYWDVVRNRLKKLDEIKNFISITHYLKGELAKTNITTERVIHIYDPIMTEQISKLTKKDAREKLKFSEHTILFVGTLSKLKGADLILRIAESMPHVKFIVFGNGPLEEKFKKSKLTNLDYKGFASSAQLRDYYRAADLFLNPVTAFYGVGRVTVEAMINGLPHVGFKIRGISELIKDGETGVILIGNTLESITKQIDQILNDGELLAKISRNSIKKTLLKFELGTIIKQVILFYKTLIKNEN